MNKIIKRVIFWEPCESPHKDAFFSSLSEYCSEVEIICCAQESIPIERKKQGWKENQKKCYNLKISPNEIEISKLVNTQIKSTIHVFSGIRHVPIIKSALSLVLKNDCMFFVMSEPRVFEGLKGYLRLVQSWFFEHHIRKTVLGVFAIGANGPQWFKKAGYKKDLIYKFAYYLPKQEKKSHLIQKKIHLMYIGRLINLKGVKYIIGAANELKDKVFLDVIGSGDDKKELQRLVKNNNVRFHGNISNDNIPDKLSFADILILPSISDDGWGAVVSEALLQGCAVIVTKKVGSSSIVVNDKIGLIVKEKNIGAIKQAVLEISNEGFLNEKFREYRSNFANNYLVGSYGAMYFWDVIQNRINKKTRNYDFIKNENP